MPNVKSIYKLLNKPAGRALAATAVGSVGMLTTPQSTEAMPAGVFTKIASKASKGAISSASKRLAGRVLNGKIIKTITKGKGIWRSIQFTDGTEMLVEKKYIHDLSRLKGTKAYIDTFKRKDPESKTIQALKSLKYHKARMYPYPSRTHTRRMHQQHLSRGAELSTELPQKTNFVTHEGAFFQMPEEYAKHLEKLGIVKISKGKRDIQALKIKTQKPKPRIKKLRKRK